MALLVALVASLATIAVDAKPASAVFYTFCTAVYGPYDHCDGSAVALRASQAYDDYGSNRVCAGAVLNGSFYASYACGSTFAQHCYSGANNLNPRAHNGENFSQQMHGGAIHSNICP